jgi:hypothetical protein
MMVNSLFIVGIKIIIMRLTVVPVAHLENFSIYTRLFTYNGVLQKRHLPTAGAVHLCDGLHLITAFDGMMLN